MHSISVSTLAFDGHDFAAACVGIAQAGASYVEPAFVASYGDVSEDIFVASKAREMGRAMHAAGVSCTVLSAHVDMGGEAAQDQLGRRLDFAAELGASRLITNTGAAGTEERFLRNVAAVAEKARELDIVVCLENPGAGDNLFSSGSDMLEWADRLAYSHIGFNYDCGNVFTATSEGVDPAVDIECVLPFVTHLHLKDFQSDSSGWRICPIGQGAIGYDRLLARVAEVRPDLALSVEMPLRMSRPGRAGAVLGAVVPFETTVGSVRQSLQYLSEKLKATDINI